MTAQPSNILWQSSKHLEAGDPAPELKPDLLTVYSMRFCPFAQRARLVLQYKQIPHQVVNVNLVRKADWFLAVNAAGKVPTLREPDGWVLADSLIVSDYLEEAHPEKPLYPKDARQRAGIRLAVSKVGELVVPAFYRWLGSSAGSDEQKAGWEAYLAALTALQNDLGESKYFGGCDHLQMGDLMVWPWFERLRPCCQMLGYELPEARFPRLLAWMERVSKERAVAEIRLSDEAHAKFLHSYMIEKNAKYDD